MEYIGILLCGLLVAGVLKIVDGATSKPLRGDARSRRGGVGGNYASSPVCLPGRGCTLTGNYSEDYYNAKLAETAAIIAASDAAYDERLSLRGVSESDTSGETILVSGVTERVDAYGFPVRNWPVTKEHARRNVYED